MLLRPDAPGLDAARARLRTMFDDVSRAAPSSAGKLDLGEIAPEGAAHVNAALRAAGVEGDVSGFHHEVDAYAARHAFKEHGAQGTEVPRGQLALTSEDWASIPDVLAAPDRVDYVGRTGVGRDGIQILKRVNGHIVLVEEVRTGRKTMAVTSMRKFKASSP